MINLLVVDDEEPFRRLLKKELTRKGYAVEVVPDGSDALRLLQDKFFDVILLDVVMPGIDGISLMKKLKEDSGTTSPGRVADRGEFRWPQGGLRRYKSDFHGHLCRDRIGADRL